MDIMGSALANPTVPWAYSNRRLMASNKRDLKVECESVSETDRPSANKKRRSYQSRDDCDTSAQGVKRSLPSKLKQLFRRGGDPCETEPLLFGQRIGVSGANKKLRSEKLKAAGRRFRKALQRSLLYMAEGMENMSTMVWVSANVPNPMPSYYRNNTNYNMPYY